LGRRLTDWVSFVVAIAQADRYWGKRLQQLDLNEPVIGDEYGWLTTITLGHPVVRRTDWSDLTQEDRHLILGRPPYGWLGSMGGAGIANNVFREPTPQNLRIRRDIRAALEPVLQAGPAQFADAACDFIAAVDAIPHFSGGIATRLLALARPDRAISVNNASRRRLAQLPICLQIALLVRLQDEDIHIKTCCGGSKTGPGTRTLCRKARTNSCSLTIGQPCSMCLSTTMRYRCPFYQIDKRHYHIFAEL
jgi:hypothetical protein